MLLLKLILKIINGLKANYGYFYLCAIANNHPEYLAIITDIIIATNNEKYIFDLLKATNDINTQNKLKEILKNSGSPQILDALEEYEYEQINNYFKQLYYYNKFEEIKNQKQLFNDLFTSHTRTRKIKH